MLCFPHRDLLEQALREQVVPPELALTPVTAAFDTANRLWLEPAQPLPECVLAALRTLGISTDQQHEQPLLDQADCWHQLLALRRARTETAAPILFELANWYAWPRLVAMLERCGAGAAGWSWFEDAAGRLFVLVHQAAGVALERDDWLAYAEQAPRVWVASGYAHPLAEQLTPPPGHWLLLRPPRCWSVVAEAPWQERLDELPLTAVAVRGEDGSPPLPLSLPLRLKAQQATDEATLWVFRAQPETQLGELLRGTDDGLLADLLIAEVTLHGRSALVLRARPGQRLPPILQAGERYVALPRLPNVYLPQGYCLQPALRFDVLRSQLAVAADQVVWLRPLGAGAWARESVAAAAFRPLLAQVDYVWEAAGETLRPWCAAKPFAFEKFGVAVTAVPPPLREQVPEAGAPLVPRRGRWWPRWAAWVRNRLGALATRLWPSHQAAPDAASDLAASLAPDGSPDALTEAVRRFLQQHAAPETQPAPAAAGAQVAPLERQLLKLTTPLDHPQRSVLWAQLAELYHAEERLTDAAACWLHALWQQSHEERHLLGWWRAEARAARWDKPAAELASTLGEHNPSQEAIRAATAYLVWAGRPESPAPLPPHQLAALRQFLARHEGALPLRAAWLAWQTLAQQRGGDPLLLARARDRLLARLLRQGLSLDRDLPACFRFGGSGAEGRSDSIRAWLVRQREPVQRWLARLDRTAHVGLDESAPEQLTCTQAYADLMLAWGLAARGAEREALALASTARGVLGHRDASHRFLLEAFSYRIAQASQEDAPTGPLPSHLRRLHGSLTAEERYKVDWFRRQARLLEPRGSVDPYQGHVQRGYFDDLQPLLAGLGDLHDPEELARQVRRLLAEAAAEQHPAAEPRIWRAALEQAPRAGEAVALDLLTRCLPVLNRADSPAAGPLLQQALLVAAHFGQTARVQELLNRLHALLERWPEQRAAALFAALAEQSFRDLRRLGCQAEVSRLAKRMAERCLRGQPVAALGRQLAEVLPTLLPAAGVWFAEGSHDRSSEVLDAARGLLLAGRLAPAQQTALARAYAACLAQAPVALALERLAELFARLEGVYDRMTTRSHFALAPLEVVEAAVRAVAAADFALEAPLRRWLDEDEYLVRQRLHRDLHAIMQQQMR